MLLHGLTHLSVPYNRQADLEVDQITLRWKSLEPSGLLLVLEDDSAGVEGDRLEMAVVKGRLVIKLVMEGRETLVEAGDRLDDNMWHTVEVVREGRVVTTRMDGVPGKMEAVAGTASVLRRNRILLAGRPRGEGGLPNFSGSLQVPTYNILHSLQYTSNIATHCIYLNTSYYNQYVPVHHLSLLHSPASLSPTHSSIMSILPIL